MSFFSHINKYSLIFIFLTFFLSITFLGYIYLSSLILLIPPSFEAKNSALSRNPLVKYVFIFLLDGVRYDALVDSNICPGISQLIKEGALLNNNRINFPSGTQQGITSIMTGSRPGRFSWMLFNTYKDKVPVESIVDTCKEQGIPTFYQVNRPWWYEFFGGYKVFEGVGASPETAEIVSQESLKTIAVLHKYKTALVVIHIEAADHMGHVYGGKSVEYKKAVSLSDNIVTGCREELLKRNLMKDSIMIITSDHGHLDRGGHGDEEDVVCHTPLLFLGKGITPIVLNEKSNITDIAPTIAFIFGTRLPNYSEGTFLYSIFNKQILSDERIALYKYLLSERNYLQIKAKLSDRQCKDMENRLICSLNSCNRGNYEEAINISEETSREITKIKNQIIFRDEMKNIFLRGFILLVILGILSICGLKIYNKLNITLNSFLTGLLSGLFISIITGFLVYNQILTFSSIPARYTQLLIVFLVLSLMEIFILGVSRKSLNIYNDLLNVYIIKNLLFLLLFIPYLVLVGIGRWSFDSLPSSSFIFFSLLILVYPFLTFPVIITEYIIIVFYNITKLIIKEREK